MRLRLYHHHDGARVAYREIGTGPSLALLHSALLSHKEWEPAVEQLSHRYRVVLPDLPLHGDSEHRPRHPYTPDWFADVLGGFAAEVLGPRPMLAAHATSAELLLHALARGRIAPARLVLMSSRLHAPAVQRTARATFRVTVGAAAVPGLDSAVSYAAPLVFSPAHGMRLSARGNPAARDLLRHAFADVPGNASLARSWAKAVRAWQWGPRSDLLELYPRLDMPVLLLWADRDRVHPAAPAEEALRLLPRAQLRVLESTGFLMAYDDPVGLARELAAFCG
jgi:pimeloyl-ACP methyl ester carboxylesterase